jgi:hypothetical protein
VPSRMASEDDEISVESQLIHCVRILVETGQGFQTKLDTNSI